MVAIALEGAKKKRKLQHTQQVTHAVEYTDINVEIDGIKLTYAR